MLGAGMGHAGMLELANGAKIPGQLVRLDGRTVVWDADLIGQITVSADSVTRIEGPAPPAIGRLEGIRDADCSFAPGATGIEIECAGKAPVTTSWAALEKAELQHSDSGKITATLSQERGNNFTDEVELDLRLQRRRENRRHTLTANVDYEEKREVTSSDDASVDYQFDYILREDWFRYAKVEYRRDPFTAIREGLVAGVGVGRTWQFGQNDLLLQAGPLLGRFEIEDFGRTQAGGVTLRWRADSEAQVWRVGLKLFHEGELSQLFPDRDLHRIDTRTGIEIPLRFGIIGEIRVDYDWAGVKLPEGEDYDLKWVVALGYQW